MLCLQEYEEHVQELERLRWVHEASQMQHVTTLAWQAKQQAMLACLKASTARAGGLEVCTCAPAFIACMLKPTHLSLALVFSSDGRDCMILQIRCV